MAPQYVDEEGNPVDPALVDAGEYDPVPDSLPSYVDEDGNEVDPYEVEAGGYDIVNQEEPGRISRTIATITSGLGDISRGVGGAVKYAEDGLGTGTKLGEYILEDNRRAQQSRDAYIPAEPGSATDYAQKITRGVTSAVPAVLSGAGIPALAGYFGGSTLGNQYQNQIDQGATEEDARMGAILPAVTSAALTPLQLVPGLNQAAPFVSRTIQSAKNNLLSAPIQTTADIAGNYIGTGNVPSLEQGAGQYFEDAVVGLGTGIALPAGIDATGKVVQSVKDVANAARPAPLRAPAEVNMEAMIDAELASLPEPTKIEVGPPLPPLEMPAPIAKTVEQPKPTKPTLESFPEPLAAKPKPEVVELPAPELQPVPEVVPVPEAPKVAKVDTQTSTFSDSLAEQGQKIESAKAKTAEVAVATEQNQKRQTILKVVDELNSSPPESFVDPTNEPATKTKKKSKLPPEEVQASIEEMVSENAKLIEQSETALAAKLDEISMLREQAVTPEELSKARAEVKSIEKVLSTYKARAVKYKNGARKNRRSERGAAIIPGAKQVSAIRQKAIELLGGYVDPALKPKPLHPDDQWFATPILGPARKQIIFPSTMASKNVKSRLAYDIGKKGSELKNSTAYDLYESGKDYLALPDTTKVDQFLRARRRRLSAARASKRAVPVLTDQNLAKLGLSEAEIGAIRSIDMQMKRSLDVYEDGLLADVPKIKGYKKVIEGENGPEVIEVTQEQAQTQYASDIMDFIQNLRDTGYVTFARKGTKYKLIARDPSTLGEDGKPVVKSVSYHNYGWQHGKKAKELRERGFEVSVEPIPKVYNDAFTELPADLASQTHEFNPDKWTENAKQRPPGGATKHLIEASLIEGEDTNLKPGISRYVLGLSNWHAQKIMQPQVDEALSAMKDGSALKSYWVKYFDDLQSGDWTAPVTQFVNHMYLAGVPASGSLNLTQSLTTTFPAMFEYVKNPAANSAMLTKAAAKASDYLIMEATGKGNFANKDPLLNAALHEAFRKGVTQAQAYDALNSAQVSSVEGAAQNLNRTLMMTFSAPEKFNRVTAYITGWELAKKTGFPESQRMQFAEDFVNKTQFEQTPYNRPQFARKGVMKLATQFRFFPGHYLRFLTNAAAKGDKAVVGVSLGVSMLLGGSLAALPFSRELLRFAEGMGADPRVALRRLVDDPDWADALLFGAPAPLLGVNISSSIGSGELIPDIENQGTRGLVKTAFGPMGDYALKIGDSYDLYMNKDEPAQALENLLPRYARNPAKAVRMGTTEKGALMDGNNVPVIESSSLGEQMLVAGGYNLRSGAREYERRGVTRRFNEGLVNDDNFNQRFGKALVKRDVDSLKKILGEIAEHNSTAKPGAEFNLNDTSVVMHIIRQKNPRLYDILKTKALARPELMEIFSHYGFEND